MPLKHHGEADFPVTIGIYFSPAAFTKNAKVMRIFDFFPPLQAFFASARVLSGNARKKGNQFHPHSTASQACLTHCIAVRRSIDFTI